MRPDHHKFSINFCKEVTSGTGDGDHDDWLRKAFPLTKTAVSQSSGEKIDHNGGKGNFAKWWNPLDKGEWPPDEVTISDEWTLWLLSYCHRETEENTTLWILTLTMIFKRAEYQRSPPQSLFLKKTYRTIYRGYYALVGHMEARFCNWNIPQSKTTTGNTYEPKKFTVVKTGPLWCSQSTQEPNFWHWKSMATPSREIICHNKSFSVLERVEYL